MCLRDLINLLLARGVAATEAHIRWAIRTGRVSRPRLDGSPRFDFDERQVGEIIAYLASRNADRADGNKA